MQPEAAKQRTTFSPDSAFQERLDTHAKKEECSGMIHAPGKQLRHPGFALGASLPCRGSRALKIPPLTNCVRYLSQAGSLRLFRGSPPVLNIFLNGRAGDAAAWAAGYSREVSDS